MTFRFRCAMALPLIIVTGISGAGRTTALKALEDLGYHVTDNLPLVLIPKLVDHALVNGDDHPIVVGLRTVDFEKDDVEQTLKILHENTKINLHIVYLECSDDIIFQRYGETRRPHPIKAKNLTDAVALEKALLTPFKKIAEMQLDSSDLDARHLRKILQHYFSNETPKSPKIQFVSFSYKKRTPRFADLVVDMRFLSNPFYDNKLRHLSGKDKSVQDFIKTDQRWMIIEHHFKEFLIHAIDGYIEQGRSYLTIAFGCTGGQHRSVFVAEFFNKLFQKMNYDCIIDHCDLEMEKL